MDLAQSGVDFAELINTIDMPNDQIDYRHFNRQLSNISHASQTISMRSISRDSLQNCTEFQDIDTEFYDENVPIEAITKRKERGLLYVNYFRFGARWPILLIVLFALLLVQLLASAADYWVSLW